MLRKITWWGAVPQKPGKLPEIFWFSEIHSSDLLAPIFEPASPLHDIQRGKEIIVSQIAGGGSRGFQDGIGGNVLMQEVMGFAVAANGNLVFADFGNNRIRMLSSEGFSVHFFSFHF